MVTTVITDKPTNPQTLQVLTQCMMGRNQVQRAVGNYSALYYADGATVQDVYTEIAPNTLWTSNPQETFKTLVVSCSGVLVLDGVTVDLLPLRLTINKLLVLDTELRSFKLTNVGLDDVRAQLNFVSTQQLVSA